ncbi:MAG: hypothetical protein AB7K24_32390, partial [Gemmataceae bacterium]
RFPPLPTFTHSQPQLYLGFSPFQESVGEKSVKQVRASNRLRAGAVVRELPFQSGTTEAPARRDLRAARSLIMHQMEELICAD